MVDSSPPLDLAVWSRLQQAARAAAGRAHCPYSRFAVGAAVLLADGRVVAGCNVENASYGLTVCAERNALAAAVAAGGAGTVEAVLVYTPTEHPTPPCGACRQVLLELAPGATVLSVAQDGSEARWRVEDLLPSAFQLG